MRLPAKLPANLLIEIGINFVLPWLAYTLAQPRWGETIGLIASAIPPLLWSLVELLRFRRIDALSVLVLLGIALSVVAMAVGGSPRLLLMRESLISGAVGMVFLVSLLMRRPLLFYLARATIARQQGHQGNHDRFEELWRTRPNFGKVLRKLTWLWGTGLVLETSLKVWMAWHWPIPRVLAVSPFVSYGIYGALTAYTFWYRRRLQGSALLRA